MKSQKYNVNFRVEVKNLSLKDNPVSIIMPSPLQTSYQRLLGQYRINPPTGKIKRESRFQNRYIHWEKNLKPGKSKIFEFNFKVSVKQRGRGLNNPDNSYRQFLKSDKFINVNKRIIKMSKDLVGDIDKIEEKVKVLNNFVVQNLEYGNPIEDLYSSNDALKKEKVDCGGFNTLLAALCIASKIPARLVSGFFAAFGPNQMHAWLEIFLPGKGWISADPSIEKLSKEGRTKKFAELEFVGNDRIALSLGQNFKIKIGSRSLNLAILQNPKVLADGKISYSSNFDPKVIK